MTRERRELPVSGFQVLAPHRSTSCARSERSPVGVLAVLAVADAVRRRLTG